MSQDLILNYRRIIVDEDFVDSHCRYLETTHIILLTVNHQTDASNINNSVSDCQKMFNFTNYT